MLQLRCIRLVGVLLLASVSLSFAVADESADTLAAGRGPAEVVSAFHASLLQAMQAGSAAGISHRTELLDPVIRTSFDLPFITKTVLGKHWDALTDEQRKQFHVLFSQFMITTYASKFNSHSGETFAFVDESRERPNVQLVRATFTESNGNVRRFDYQLLNRKEIWRIVNIAVDGVSDLSLKRAEYSDVIEKDGFEALVSLLEQRIRELEQDA